MRALTLVRATHSIFCSPAVVMRYCKAAISDIPSEEVMPIKVGINGFGRIGRNIMRTALDDKEIQFVAVNDVTDAKTLAHLLKYDSVLGNLPHKVTHTDDTIAVEGKSFKVFKTKDPAEIDWASVGADIVVESTGLFTKGADVKKHLRAPAAAINLIPSSTGAAKALHLVIPELKGKLDGYAMRVPTPNVSVVDLTVFVDKPATRDAVNAALKAAASGPMKGILGYTEEELVSADFKGNSNSSIVDAEYTKVVGDRCVKVLAWYDNEWGYSCRCRDLIKLLASKL